jgi:glycosyltransferase involved in cell wall biosynthesis
MNYAVIAAKDEAETIGPLVRALRAQGLGVVVVNDGSTDATRTIAVRHGAVVLDHETGQGIGPSLLQGWRLALGMGADAVVQLDAGGSHDPAQAGQLLAGLDGADMVIGSRFCPGGVYVGRRWRAWASRLAAALLNFAAHARIHDWTSGYRAYSRQALELLLSKSYYQTMHAWQIEVLGQALGARLRVAEQPITYRAGRSSLKAAHVSEAIGEWLAIFFR